MLIGAVYDLETKQVKRVIVPDNDTQLVSINWADHDEGFLMLHSSTIPDDPYLYNEFINQAVLNTTTSLA